jgi:uncharacterized membrane protein SpoIIM required for sporulation
VQNRGRESPVRLWVIAGPLFVIVFLIEGAITPDMTRCVIPSAPWRSAGLAGRKP